VGQAVSHISRGDRHDQAKVRQNQLARRLDVVLALNLARELESCSCGEHRKTDLPPVW